MIKSQGQFFHVAQKMKWASNVRDAVKNVLADFFREGGGVPPLSVKGFWAQYFSVKGGKGVPPNSAKENSCKKQVF